MATIKFRVRKSTVGNSGMIQLELNYGKLNRFRYSTGYKIKNVKNWDSKKMRIKNVISEPNKTQINNDLNKLTANIEEFYMNHVVRDKELMTNSNLKNFCEVYFNKKENKKKLKPNFFNFFDWYIEHFTKNPLPSTGTPLSKGTVRTYTNSLNIFRRFDAEVYKLNYSNITLDFYDDFVNWMNEKDYSLNYIGTQIKILKTILNMATEKGFNENIDFQKKYFKKPSEQIENIFLSIPEVQLFYEADLSQFKGKIVNGLKINLPMLEKARDLFVIGCFTGLRVSDYNRLNKSHIYKDENGNSYFRLLMQKVNKPVTIPLNSIVKEILNKYNGEPPSYMQPQHINYCLKIIGELAKIDSATKKTITKSGVKKTIDKPKYKLITNHTARRSFCTNAYLSNMPTADIMAISGHSQERTFYNYIKVNDLQKAQKIATHKFFK